MGKTRKIVGHILTWIGILVILFLGIKFLAAQFWWLAASIVAIIVGYLMSNNW